MLLYTSTQHRFNQLTKGRMSNAVGCSNTEGLYKYDLPSILKERVVGTEGHAEVQEVCLSKKVYSLCQSYPSM